MPPIALTDDQLSALFAAAQPLARDRRDGFLVAVAEILGAIRDPGDGDVNRAIRKAQREFFDPPLDSAPGRPSRHA